MLDNIDLKLKLKIMYILTIVLAGGFGIMMLIAPNLMISLFGVPAQDPYMFGVVSAVWTTFGILGILGLRNPVKFIPLLLLQFIYKLLWIFAVFLPNLILSGFRVDTLSSLLIFILFIVGDFLTIPFKEIFEKSE